jgi:8-oxo-dGTP pyrophosphatase MutT (NUDIX family)
MKDDVGIFRVAVSAIILNAADELLLTQRSLKRDHHPGEWETMSGRLAQGEDFIAALHREVKEELDIIVEPVTPLSTFHFYRGSDQVEHVGITYLCRHVSGKVKVDGLEEVAYQWIDLRAALEIVKDAGIQRDIKLALAYLKNNKTKDAK